jgi:post-segregation antitoxin (ccd killing protein)
MSGFRITIYLHDAIHRQAKLLDLNISQVCEAAINAAVEQRIAQLENMVAGADNARRLLEQVASIPDEPEEEQDAA